MARTFRASDNAQLRYKLRELQEQLAQLSTVYLPGQHQPECGAESDQAPSGELDESDRRDAELILRTAPIKRDSARQQKLRSLNISRISGRSAEAQQRAG